MKNRVQLIGHVGQEPEIKNLESGRVANFTIATNESYTNAKGEKVEQTEWHRVSAWGKTVDIIEKLLTKGSHVAIDLNKKEFKLNVEVEDEMKLRQLTDILINRAHKQGISPEAFDLSKEPYQSGKLVKQEISVRNGLKHVAT